MMPLKLAALKQIPETTQLDRFLLESFTFDQVMTMIQEKISNLSVFDRFARALNWRYIAETMPMSETMMRRFDLYLDWPAVSRYQRLSEDFIKFYEAHVDWDNICQYQQLSFEFVKDNVHDDFLLDLFFSQPQLQWRDEQFEKYMEYYNAAICKTQHLSEDWISANVDVIEWYDLSCAHRTWSDAFLTRFSSRLDTARLCYSAILTEQQIETLQQWAIISSTQSLSTEFILKHADVVVWHLIASKQNLSGELVERIQRMDGWTDDQMVEFSENVINFLKIQQFPLLCHWATLSAREDMDESILLENRSGVDWQSVCITTPSDTFLFSVYSVLSPDYVSKHASEHFLLAHPQFITRDVQENKRIVSMSFFKRYFVVFGAGHLAAERYLSSDFIDENWGRLNSRLLLRHQQLNHDQLLRMPLFPPE